MKLPVKVHAIKLFAVRYVKLTFRFARKRNACERAFGFLIRVLIHITINFI